jgi:mRNA interferase HicA
MSFIRSLNYNGVIFGLDIVHSYVYDRDVKRKDLEKTLKGMGWWFLRHGGRHDVWTDGDREEPIPRHTDINEKLARSILRKAKKGEKL